MSHSFQISAHTRSALRSETFNRLSRVSPEEIAVCALLGLDVSGFPRQVAVSLAYSVLGQVFGQVQRESPSDRQVAFARSRGIHLSNETRPVADAVVDALMTVWNRETIDREHLEPGVQVENVYRPGVIERISSITEDGTVYLRGGNGKRGWARNLRRVSESV